ncbi:hypothetical protein MTO96_016987 [Rhipicephalus appendiculatus]
MELFENASEGHVSDPNIDSGGEGGCDDMGITELCNFIEENSVVEEARDNPVSRCSPPAWKVPGSPTRHVETRKHTIPCDSSRATESFVCKLERPVHYWEQAEQRWKKPFDQTAPQFLQKGLESREVIQRESFAIDGS